MILVGPVRRLLLIKAAIELSYYLKRKTEVNAYLAEHQYQSALIRQ